MLDTALALIERQLSGRPLPDRPLSDGQRSAFRRPAAVEERQRPILAQARALAALHDGERDPVRERLAAALVEVGQALDACAVPRDEDGDPLPADPRWEPWTDVEDWVLGKGKFTGSARRLGVLYLARSLDLTLERDDYAAGGLDAENAFRARILLNARERPDGLPPRFWTVATMYGAVLADALHRPGD